MKSELKELCTTLGVILALALVAFGLSYWLVEIRQGISWEGFIIIGVYTCTYWLIGKHALRHMSWGEWSQPTRVVACMIVLMVISYLNSVVISLGNYTTG